MPRLLIFLHLIFATSITLAAEKEIASSEDNALRVNELPREVQDRISGCSCGFERPVKGKSSSLYVVGWLLGDDTAFMNINGTTEELKLVSERNERKKRKKSKSEPAVGDKTIYVLKNSSTTATIDCTVSTTCWGQSECESIGYSGRVAVEGNGRTLEIPVKGWCGC